MSGIFGVMSKDNCMSTLYYGTDYHSHMGAEYGGIAFLQEGGPVKKIHDISNTQFKAKFYEGSDHKFSSAGIGIISDRDPQPLVFESRFGRFAICCAGLVTNREELASELLERRIPFSEISHGEINQTEVIANLINIGDTIIEGIDGMYDRIEGSISLLILTSEGIYAARDRNGVTPLVLGEKDGEMAIASESCSFPNLGFKVTKFLKPGEIVRITQDSVVTLQEGSDECKICAFLWIYTGFPASAYEGINVQTVRENCGGFLARRDRFKADLVAGVPDSGTSHAIGYAMESGIPFRSVLFKYTQTYGRSYIPLSQAERDRIALMKLIPNEDTIRGSRIILCEDSIVRGTQLKNFTITKLRNAGVKEVHVRPACPPLMFPCKYNFSTRSVDELIARRAIKDMEGGDPGDLSEYLDPDSGKYGKMIGWIEKELGLDSLMYQRLDDMVEAIGLPRDRLCLHCWTGSGL